MRQRPPDDPSGGRSLSCMLFCAFRGVLRLSGRSEQAGDLPVLVHVVSFPPRAPSAGRAWAPHGAGPAGAPHPNQRRAGRARPLQGFWLTPKRLYAAFAAARSSAGMTIALSEQAGDFFRSRPRRSSRRRAPSAGRAWAPHGAGPAGTPHPNQSGQAEPDPLQGFWLTPKRLYAAICGGPAVGGHDHALSEQAGDLPVLVHVDLLGGGRLRQAGHGHNVPGQGHQEAGAGGHLDVPHGDGKILRGPQQVLVVGEGGTGSWPCRWACRRSPGR